MSAQRSTGWTGLVRRVGVRVGLVAASLVVVELLSLVMLVVLTGHWRPVTALEAQRHAVSGREVERTEASDDRPLRIREGVEVLHPYLGFVLDPSRLPPGEVHELGFHDIEAVMEPAREDRLIVAIFGGSVAGQLWEGRAALEQALERLEVLRGRELVVVPLALSGYKQPQQVLALEYLLAIGGHVDVIVNLDGFNEVVLPWYDNASHGVFPFYPRSWYWRTGNLSDPELVRRAGTITVLEDLRSSVARSVSEAWWHGSPLVNLVWLQVDRLVAARIAAARAGSAEANGDVGTDDGTDARPYLRTGPFHEASRAAVLEASAQLWARAAIDMDAVARRHGIVFLEALQPNQYYQGSKPLSAEELRQAIQLESGYGPIAREGYPFLVEAGQQIADAGVAYADLTMLFADEPRTLYKDPCCHLNELGMNLLAEAVAARLVLLVAEAEAGGAPAPQG